MTVAARFQYVDHGRARDLLGALVLGTAPEDKRAELDTHVATCLVCRREIRELEATADDALARSWEAVQRRLRDGDASG
jgi:hypothetical protein